MIPFLFWLLGTFGRALLDNFFWDFPWPWVSWLGISIHTKATIFYFHYSGGGCTGNSQVLSMGIHLSLCHRVPNAIGRFHPQFSRSSGSGSTTWQRTRCLACSRRWKKRRRFNPKQFDCHCTADTMRISYLFSFYTICFYFWEMKLDFTNRERD